MELIIFVIIVSMLFPGSSGGSHFEFMMIPVVIICGALILAVGAGTMYAAMGITMLIDDGNLGVFMLAWFGVIGAVVFTNKAIGDWIDRRKACRAAQVQTASGK